MKLPSLSVFFPCYNDAATIGGLVREAARVGPRLAEDLEIIVVNDGSTDDSATVLSRLVEEIPSLRVVSHPRNRGYGGALRSGFEAATATWVFYTDGDGQYAVTDLARLVDRAENADVVNGRQERRRDAWHRIAAGWTYRALLGMLFHVPIRDVDCDFRLIRRDALRGVALTCDSGAICIELVTKLARNNARFVEVPVQHFARVEGRSQFFRPLHIARTLFDVLALRRALSAESHTTREGNPWPIQR